MAIELIKAPSATADAGMFNLPSAFDPKRHAAEWVEEGQVNFKQQRQVLPQTNKTADGWDIWRKDPTDEPTAVYGSGKRKFILMCRSRAIQDEVNAIFGNVTKNLLNQTVAGQLVPTQEGLSGQAPGILTEEQLKTGRGTSEEVKESTLPLNREAVFDGTAAAT